MTSHRRQGGALQARPEPGRRASLVGFAVCLLLAACAGGGGGDGGGSPNPAPGNNVNPPQPVTLSPNTLGVIAVIDGGTTNDYFHDLGINLESTTSYLTLLIPSTVEGTVIDQITSYSFAKHSLSSYRTDDRLFRFNYFFEWPQRLDLIELDPETMDPVGSSITLSDSPDDDNVSIVGNNIYYRQAVHFDALCGCNEGGEFKVRDVGQNASATLLAVNNGQNQGTTINLADSGILYAVDLDVRPGDLPPAAHVIVRRRNLSTGAFDATVRDYSLTDYAAYKAFWGFKIDNGTLYILRQDATDDHVEVLGAGLTGVLQSSSDPHLVYSSDAVTGSAVLVNNRVWDVDHGRIVLYLDSPPQAGDQFLVVDTSAVPLSTQVYSIGPGTDLFHLRAIFRD